MSFNDQNNQNPTGSLNNANNGSNNNNNSSNMFPNSNNNKNTNTECKTSQNCANSTNNNYLDFDFNDCDLFGGNNHHMMGGAHHNHHQQQQNNMFFDQTFGGCGTTSAAQGQGHIYFAPMKYGYLGQQEEQIFHDKQMNNFPDFEFGTNFFGNANQNPYSLNNVNSLNNNQNNGNINNSNNANNNNNHSSSNNGNNNFLANNFLFSTYNTNNAVDLADLFPSEPVPKLENKQPSHSNNYYMENPDQFSPIHHNGSTNNNTHTASSQQPIIAKTECSGNNCNSSTGLMSNSNNVMGGCNNFIGSTFNMNANNGCMFGERSGMHMMPPHNPYGNHHAQSTQQAHYGMMNDHSHLPSIHQAQHMIGGGLQGSNQIPSYHHIGANPIHQNVSMIHHSQQGQNISIIGGNKNNVFSIVKDQQKEKKKDYDKNICRYITRQVVRSFSSPEFKNKVLCIISDIYPEAPSQNILQIYKDVTEFFLGEIENLSGFRALKDILVVNSDLDGTILATQKRIFRDFMRWYLKERYFRNIISGNMKDKLAFIRYKNKIMLHYINKPHKWNSNKKKKLGKISSPTHNSSNGVGSAPFSSVNLSKQEY